MKRFLLFLLILAGLTAKAQVFNNEWIDYNKTYYKFKVGATGVYRISQGMLSSIGLGSTPAEHFQLWRNGEEVPLYTSVQAGSFGAGDYIEFWGMMNDGTTDSIMYRVNGHQLNKKWSLQTDTAAFFLTVNTSANNKRLVPAANDLAGNVLPAEPFFMHVEGKYYKERIGQGYAQVVGETVYSSAYDGGEGWTSNDISKGGTKTEVLSGLFPYTGPGAPVEANFRINASGYNGSNPRTFRVKLNGDSILGQQMDFFDFVKLDHPIPSSMLAGGSATVEVTNQSPVPGSDRMVVAQIEINYARSFNFGNKTAFEFTLPANTNGNYLEITNFNHGGTPPVLYDFTNGKRYVADISNPALVKIALQPSIEDRKLVLVSESPATIFNVTIFQQRNFVNYGLAANQGDYLIITHPKLLNGAGGSKPVEDYQAYRRSAAGGGFNVKIYMIDELVDQFGLGIKMHPLSVRNFLRWARATYTQPIKNAFLIGKGVHYMHFRQFESNPLINQLCFVPTFGFPASDILLAAEPGPDQIPKTPIGRLAVVYPEEITTYLNKVIQYEQAQASQSPYIRDKAWMKNAIHVVGANDEGLSNALRISMDAFKRIIIDTFYGANVITFSKSSPDEVELASNARLQSLFQEGVSLVTYFGHSSATALQFNLDNPQNYNNSGKYPLFILLGCNAGNFYNYNALRLQTKETISEKFVLAEDRGSIATIASTHLGVVHYLDIYNNKNYRALGVTKYGRGLGEVMIEAIIQTFNQTKQTDYYARFHCEQATLHGDPAVKVNTTAKPDYAIEDELVTINPAFISVAESNFKVKAKFMNLGKALSDSITIEVKRTLPNGTVQVTNRVRIPGIRYIDSLTFTIPITPNTDKGLNKITITVDADNDVDEIYETNINNILTKEFYIFEDEARPVYPYNFSIVKDQNIKFQVSSANPFSVMRQYTMEIDTTELFNSPLKVSRDVSTTGGVMSFEPGVTFLDSVVYYWRVSPLPTTGDRVWNVSSFIYIPNSEHGFNQSHFYQHTKSELTRMSYDSTSRLWSYKNLINNLFIRLGSWVTSGATQGSQLSVALNGEVSIQLTNYFQSIVFNVIPPASFHPWENRVIVPYSDPNNLGQGLYGSTSPHWINFPKYNFEYRYTDTASRRKMMDFMRDSIPDGHYVVVRNFTLDPVTYPTFPVAYAADWAADEALHGPGQSLYHYLKNAGLTTIDSFYRARPWALVYRKNDPSFTPQSVMGDGTVDNPILTVDCPALDTLGYMRSPVLGPARQWKQLKWRGTVAPDVTAGDSPTIDIVGINVNGTETVLFNRVDITQQDFNISSINAAQYPYLRLRLRNADSIHNTPYQLKYWRLTYDPVPEGAIAPNLYFQTRDTVDVGEEFDIAVAFKNVSPWAFTDSMRVKLVITDKANRAIPIPVQRFRILQADPDTLIIRAKVPTAQFGGLNTLFIEVNPDNDQLEQYHFNNFAYRNLYVRPDTLNPLMDVTFDGIHILNTDIVSSKPEIVIKLMDEAKWMPLDDNNLVKVSVKYPDGTTRQFQFNSDTLQFVPAGQGPNQSNTATVNFNPHFFKDGNYELIVTGRDKSDNAAGTIEYRVMFQVINKPMISNMMNYPNPFTTSTAFVFTLTGSEIPQNLRIQIMTITGKIVRDITRDELGPLRIGRNITEFKWDGTDQYGQKLANGIYLYRVITNLNGKSLDKYKAAEDNTDKYFNKGYGKMYLMR